VRSTCRRQPIPVGTPVFAPAAAGRRLPRRSPRLRAEAGGDI